MNRFSIAKVLSLFSMLFAFATTHAQVVISQVYGGGGVTTGSPSYTSDFVELFNRGTASVDLTGWSVQYASATGLTWQVSSLSGSIPAGRYLLVRQATGTAGLAALPTPDITGSMAMSAVNGKVALLNTQTALSGTCPTSANIIDLVGYGGANCYETTSTAVLSPTTAVIRKNGGCTDVGNNSTDFNVAAPAPRNSATAANACVTGAVSLSINDVSVIEGNSGTTIAAFTVTLSSPAPAGGVSFDIATADGTATVAGGDYVAATASATIPEGGTTYTFNVTINGDTTAELNETFFVNITNVVGATVSDAQGQGTIQNDDIAVVQIHDIQGSGTVSPLNGFSVRTTGIVTAVYPGFRGFYMQTPDANADNDPNTSEGIFVFTNSTTLDAQLAPGVEVRVTGIVSEFPTASGATQIGGNVSTPLALEFLSTGNALPAPISISLPLASLSELEKYEGMRVTLPQTLTVTSNFTLGRYGEVVLSSGGRLFTPSNVIDLNDNPATGTSTTGVSNIAAITAATAANALNQVTLDDVTSTENPDPAPFGLAANNTLRSGSTIANVVGIVNQIAAGYRILSDPSNLPNFDRAARPLTPPNVGGQMKAAGFNVLNYFNGDGAGGGFQSVDPAQRGAHNLTEFNRQRAKTLAAVTGLGADIVGLIEMENDGDGATGALADLLSGLSSAQATADWLGVPLPANWKTSAIPGSEDAITTRLIYKNANVEPVGSPLVCVNAAFANARAPLAQVFRSRATGGSVIVSINHFKSKGSCPSSGADTDQGDGQGCWAARRLEQAQALIACVSNWQTATGESRVLLFGDFNANEQENAIDAFRAAGMVTLINDGYSYAFDANFGSLDHAIATPQLVPQVSGADKWHINADEPISLDYNTEFKSAGQVNSFYAPDAFRSSDHDPALVGMNLVANCTIDADGNGVVESDKDALLVLRYLLGFRGTALVDGAVGTNASRDATQIVSHLSALNLDADGDGVTLATTDGLLILRELLNLEGAALIDNARNSSSPNIRNATQIRDFIRNTLKYACTL